MQTAPVSPREPPARTTWPELNLVEPAPRAGARSRTLGSITPALGSAGAPSGIPIGATRSSPAACFPGAIRCPTLAAWKLTVRSAATAAPSTSPLEASTPEAMSQATTGAPQSLIAAIAAAAGSRGAPLKPVPKIASTTAPEPRRRVASESASTASAAAKRSRLAAASPRSSLGGPEQQRLDLEAGLGEQARGDQAVAAVVALAADDPHRPLRRELGDRRGDRRAGRLHQLQRGDAAVLDRPAIDLAHPVGVVERVEPGFHRRQRSGGPGAFRRPRRSLGSEPEKMRGPNSPKPLGAAIALLVLGPALIGACGGGGDFVAEADGICTDQALRVNRVLDDGGTPSNAPEAAAQAAKLLPVERDAVTRLRAVEAPAGGAGAAYGDFLAARGLALRLSERRARAARRRSGAAYAAIAGRRERVLRRADASAARAGLLACAEHLSRRATRAVKAAISRIATSPDPALCERAVHRELRPLGVRRPRRCRRRQERRSGAADSVEIADLRGIDGVYALATVIPRGGDSGGRRLLLGMLYEDGAYKADSLESAPP